VVSSKGEKPRSASRQPGPWARARTAPASSGRRPSPGRLENFAPDPRTARASASEPSGQREMRISEGTMRASAAAQPPRDAMHVPASPVDRSVQARATAWPFAWATARVLGLPAASTAASTDVPGVMRRSGRSPAGSTGCSETATLHPAASSRAMATSAVPAGMPHMGMSGASFCRRRVSWMPSRRDTVAASSPSTS